MGLDFDVETSGYAAVGIAVVSFLIKRIASNRDKEIKDVKHSVTSMSDALLKFSEEAKKSIHEMQLSIAELNVDDLKADLKKLEQHYEKLNDQLADLRVAVGEHKRGA